MDEKEYIPVLFAGRFDFLCQSDECSEFLTVGRPNSPWRSDTLPTSAKPICGSPTLQISLRWYKTEKNEKVYHLKQLLLGIFLAPKLEEALTIHFIDVV